MKFIRYEQVARERIHSIQCDVCKKVYENNSFADEIEIQEFLHIDYEAGYGTVFEDMAHIQCDVCQNCLKEKLGEFIKITPYGE
jgi:hypothetical protein